MSTLRFTPEFKEEAVKQVTTQARNWLGNKLDATKRSRVMFM